jgi:hypothetical protein
MMTKMMMIKTMTMTEAAVRMTRAEAAPALIAVKVLVNPKAETVPETVVAASLGLGELKV